MTSNTHPEHEQFPWTIAVVDHPARADSPGYRRSRELMQRLVEATPDWVLPGPPYQDHHGGAVWVNDDSGWMCLQLPLGIEWSAQFCADPAKVDRLRAYAQRLVAAFPKTLPGYGALGYHDGADLLTTPITTPALVAAWTDSIFNASLPLPAEVHTGVLPKGAGYHHYPKPIVDIEHFRYNDFQLFVTDQAGLPAAVVPVAPRGSGDWHVRVIAAHPQSSYAARLAPAGHVSASADHSQTLLAEGLTPTGPDVLEREDYLTHQAFAAQAHT